MTAQSFAYEKKGNSAVIWRCFSHDTKAEVPQMIQGLPVTAIAPYAFSAHMDQQMLERGIQEGRILIHIPEAVHTEEQLPPPLCGNQLKSVIFPHTIAHVGRYCFYNCENLQELEYHGGLSDWGSGSFTGCHRVSRLKVSVPDTGVTWLKPVLEELKEALRVEYMTGSSDGYAYLVFPEYFEEGVENTPARILEERIHGMGMRYRNCFYNKIFDFRQYDSLFALAVTQESEEIMTELAMGRLRYPSGLAEQAGKQYTDYIREHAKAAAEQILRNRDMDGLRWLFTVIGRDQKLTEYITGRASAMHFAEALSYLMEFCRTADKPVRRRREL